MNSKTVITLAVGLIIGVGGTLGVSTLSTEDAAKPATKTQQKTTSADHSKMSMEDMNKQLAELSGEDYDKAFIEMMIAHHQGALDMAELSEERAEHFEIKSLSKQIINAQLREISQMYDWQKAWGYPADPSMEMIHNH